MSSPVMRSNFDDLTQLRGFWAAFITESMRKPQDTIYSKTYYHVPSKKKSEKFSELVGLGTMVQANEYGDWNYDSPIQGYDKEIIPISYNLAVIVSREAWDDDQIGALKQYASMFARSAQETKEILAAAPFNQGFDTLTSSDGSYIFATDHPLEGGGTYRNRLTVDSDLSITSLQQAIIDMKETTDGRGKHLHLRPKYLMVPDTYEFTAREILNSTQKPYTNNNDINALQDYSLQLIINPFLTDSDSWFLIHGDINSKVHPLVYVDRKKLETNLSRIEEKSGRPYLLTSYMRCKFDCVGWRGIFGTPGAA